MIRKIITIDREKCNGCGLCAKACHEGAIGMVDGKATLLREDYCDGLGDCLPACPVDAISFVERDVPAYNATAVFAAKSEKTAGTGKLRNFPVQIKLAPVNAPYFNGADLLIAADCTAYAHPDFHNTFMAGRITLIGCPKLDGVDYAEKLTQIFTANDIRSITLVRMSVPCCGGLPWAAQRALDQSEKEIPFHIVTLDPKGQVV